jgi:Rieske Fe-S protein
MARLLRLAWLAPLSVGLWQAGRFLSHQPTDAQPPSRVVVGKPGELDALPLYVEQARAWLWRDGSGFYALDAVCTHLGCIVDRAPQGEAGYECGCHGSRFDEAGRVVNGPAQEPLRYLALEINENGDLVVDRGKSWTRPSG